MILRNILTVHSAHLALGAGTDPGESAFLALSHSLPHPATGEKVNSTKLLAAHREAWKIAGMDKTDPRRIVLLEKDPLVRALQAARIESLKPAEFSTIIADSLAALPAGGRHALAAAVFESGAAGRLVAAVAEQCGALYALAATPQDVQESVDTRSPRYSLWKSLVARLASLDPKHPDTPTTTNLFTGLFGSGEIQSDADLERAWEAWNKAWEKIREVL
jgi:hypothetical protein